MNQIITQINGLPAGRQIVLDTETTGFTPKQGHRIVELAAMEMIDGVLTGRNFHAYINPGRQVDPHAVAVHGLTNNFLRDKPRFGDIIGDFISFLEGPVPTWAHNAPFDYRFIAAEFEWAGHELSHTFECSQRLAKRLPIGTKDNKLATLAAHINYKWKGRGAHSALQDTDALATVLTQLLWPLAAQHPETKQKDRQKDKKTKPSGTKSTAQKVSAEPVRIPDNHTPLTEQSDPRIKRYDDFETEGLIFARGQKWTRDLEQSLVDAFLAGHDIPSLVKEYGRSPAALILKLEGLGVVAAGHPYTRT